MRTALIGPSGQILLPGSITPGRTQSNVVYDRGVSARHAIISSLKVDRLEGYFRRSV